MNKKRVILFTVGLLWAFGAHSANAFQYPIIQKLDTLTAQTWTIEDGLPVNTVGLVSQDSLGYLWVNTYDGLVRFDGLNFKVFNYSNTPEMPHNRTTMLHIQEGVGMWISLEYGGVMLMKNGEFTHYGNEEGFTDLDITQMHETADGRMFFVTQGGLYVYHEGQFSQYINKDDDQSRRVNKLLEDFSTNTIWAATNNGLYHLHYDGRLIKEYHLGNGIAENSFFALFQDDQGVINVSSVGKMYQIQEWELVSPPKFRVLDGLNIYNIYRDEETTIYISDGRVFGEVPGSAKIQRIEEDNLQIKEIYWKVRRDSDGVLWFIGTTGTLSIYKDGRLVPFKGIEGMQDYQYACMYEDREGNLWFGTSRHGLIKVSKSKVRTLGVPEGISGDNILALEKDHQNRILVGTRGDGLNIVEGQEVYNYDIRDGMASNIVQSIEEDVNGNIWIGYHQQGLDLMTGSEFKNHKFSDRPGMNDVRAMHSESSEELWIGTYGGLLKWNPVNDSLRIYGKEDGLSGVKIRYITKDSDGGLWTGSLDGGVSRYYKGTFTNFTTEEGLSSNNVRSIYIDEKDTGTVWVGTENNGLNRIRDGEIAYVNRDDGLPDHIVHWISEDNFGWLWISSNKGIVKIRKDELNRYMDGRNDSFSLMHYSSTEGMRNPEANGSFQEAGLKTENDFFWFATQEGVAIFDASQNGSNTVPPHVVINSVEAGGRIYDAQDAIQIERGNKSFRVNYHALTFNAPEKTRYRYRLVGYSDEWEEVYGDRSISFVDVPAGFYTFEVTAANDQGSWNEVPAEISITVLPFIYEEPWFIGLILLLIGIGYYGTSQLRYRYLLNRQHKLKRVIEDQTAEIRKEKNELEEKNKIIQQQAEELEESNRTKDKFFSLIAHDLRNPFQAILGYSDILLSDIDREKDPELWESMAYIHGSSESLLRLVENLLNWASLQSGKIKPEPETVNLKALVIEIAHIFEPVAKQKKIQLSYTADDSYTIFADSNMLQTVLRNLTSNALKFTPIGGNIHLEVKKEESFYDISVQDDGIGMSAKMANELLKLGVNTSRYGTDNEKGSGLGLLICQEMTEMHHGTILIDTEEGRGTTFTVRLPVAGLNASEKGISERN
ncbi:two-component regulator propeller domain-containing protein [Gracilimonas mengyeensis]|uniref:histidine kinase n=1 Tax=Gracilimonas mengyeensis TaxID=1302730 RepID=A0A521CD15_9BACT|nr:two-component regulator propeller domain-containing protein [Gracilimonas mengyeensis]SMO57275.1 Signal transduction histidine kinase [Gracilimonas mengyeensis]